MILVTGANGLLGSQIVRKLLEQKVEFNALRREESDLSLLNNENVNWIECDILDVTSLYKSLDKVDTVIHCAAVVSFHPSDNEMMHTVNVEGTCNVVNACIEANVKNLIHVSSIAAFGRSKTMTSINENTIWVTSSLNTAYAETKYLAELEAWRGANEGLNVAVINPSVVLAAGSEGQSSSKLFDYVWQEHTFYIDGNLNFVDARDVADAVYAIYDKEIYGERFILNAGKVEYKTLFDAISDRLVKKAPSMKANSWILWIALFMEKLKYWLTRVKPTITKEIIKTTSVAFTYDNSKSKDAFNLEYRTLDESLDWVCKDYKSSRI